MILLTPFTYIRTSCLSVSLISEREQRCSFGSFGDHLTQSFNQHHLVLVKLVLILMLVCFSSLSSSALKIPRLKPGISNPSSNGWCGWWIWFQPDLTTPDFTRLISWSRLDSWSCDRLGCLEQRSTATPFFLWIWSETRDVNSSH